jgi:hypothetical protein
MQCTIAQLQFDGPITRIKNKFFNIIPSDITSLRQCIKEKLLYSKNKQNELSSTEQKDPKVPNKEETNQHNIEVKQTNTKNDKVAHKQNDNKDRPESKNKNHNQQIQPSTPSNQALHLTKQPT